MHLPVDYSNCGNKKYFLLCVDFQRAGDKIRCPKPLECTKSCGCRTKMLNAIVVLHRCPKLMLLIASIDADDDVTLVAPTSCSADCALDQYYTVFSATACDCFR